jgi:hypothetical protein
MEPEPIPFWNVAGTLGLANGWRRGTNADVQVCSTDLATVDTTVECVMEKYPSSSKAHQKTPARCARSVRGIFDNC